MGMKGYVSEIQPFSVNDGEGIRTNVFLSGCPLRCRWCSNPEGFFQDKMMEADDVVSEINKHRLFYMQSGGGVTFTGGEATFQPEFLKVLVDKIYDLGYSMAIETCGLFDFDELRPVLEKMDLVFMDIKHMDSDMHKRFTGQGNRVILENVKRLSEVSAEVVIRIPVIEGVNGDDENIRRTAIYVGDNLPGAKMELLPYHNFGKIKYEKLGMEYDESGFERPSKERMEELKEIVRACGVELEDFR